MKVLLWFLLAIVLVTGCSNNEPAPAEPGEPAETPGGQPSGEVQYKKEIVIALADEFTTIDPMETTA